MSNADNYQRYRGKCKELAEAAVAADPTLRLVRGWFHCVMWGKQAHWWTVRPDGTIHDPSVFQFPWGGAGGEYEEYKGIVTCEECGKEVPESEAAIMDNGYAFCSMKCACRCVGLPYAGEGKS